MLTKDEKEYLKTVVKKKLEEFKEKEKIVDFDTSPVWVKKTDDFEKFLKDLLEKLEK